MRRQDRFPSHGVLARALAPRALLAWAFACGLASAPLAAQQRGNDPGEPLPGDDYVEARPFSIPDKQSARVLHDHALEHIEGGRWTEAITALERLIEEHAGSVVPVRADSELGRRSVQPLYRGAAQAARELFLQLPESARLAYADRYGAKAQELLQRARAALDRTALTELARRYPATTAARDAWWILGDLEAEAGSLDAARAAWRRAEESAPDAVAAAALAERSKWTPGDGALRASQPSYLTISEAASTLAEPPGGDAHAWDSALRIDEVVPGPPMRSPERFNCFPIVIGETVLASNSLALIAVDSLTGNPRWRSGEAPGWAEVRAGEGRALDGTSVDFGGFFGGLDREGLMAAPAAGSGVAIAALQIPITLNNNTTFQGQIKITTVIPDRRLFAFDLATGRPLWNHMPPPLWDGDSGSFSDRMRVAGPPVIAGSRVLVPAWRYQGRIAYYVACYDLTSGAYLWSTQVASGQRPLNMFGRLEREFCAPPLVIEGEKVIALTQLGTIATLDLFSGEILWQTLYNQIPLPGADGIQAAQRPSVWRNAPPAVSEGVVVATPIDSSDMVGIDLETGAVLWGLGSSRIPAEGRASYSSNWCLLGIREGLIYLGGRRVVALGSSRGLAGDLGPTTFYSSEPLMGDGFADATSLPRAVLSARHVIVPTRNERIALHLRDLKSRDEALCGTWGDARGADMGNLAIAEGALFAMSSQSLCGVLDWRSIEARLEGDYARRPKDSGLAARLASFLRERAASEHAESKPEAALQHLHRAEQILLAHSEEGLPQARATMFDILVLEARVLVDNAEASRGLERLERAVGLAPDRTHLATVLAEIVRLSRILQPAGGRPGERFESALAQLEAQCGDLEFPREDRSTPPFEARTVRRWVIEQRISHAAARSDFAREFAALVDLLSRCGDGPLSPAVAELEGEDPAQRIERRLASGGRPAWQPFEEQARIAVAAARAAGDSTTLERLTRIYPHTAAAREARDARLRLAMEQGDATTAVRTAFEELPADWSPQTTNQRQAQLVWLAARALEREGNDAFARSVIERIARFQPQMTADEQDPRTTFGSLAAARASAEPVPPEARPATFDAPASELEVQLGDSVLLGSLEVDGAPIHVFAGRDRFTALSPEGAQLWSRQVEPTVTPQAWYSNSLLASGVGGSTAEKPGGGRLVATWRGGVQAIDGLTGLPAWSWTARGNLIDMPIAADAGVLVVSTVEKGRPQLLTGLDLARGTPLWQHECPSELWAQPVVGSGLAVLLPRASSMRRAEVIELATGTTLRTIDVGQHAVVEDRRGAWIEAGRLVLPRFSRSGQEAVVAFDLESGALAWHVPSDGARELDSIVRCEGSTYLLYLGQGNGASAGSLVELDTRIGGVREVTGVDIGLGDMPIGVRPKVVTRLQAPYLFLRSPAPDSKQTLVRSVHLPYGQRWAWRLPVAQDDLYALALPLPAVSSRLVVLAYTEEVRPSSGRSPPVTHLVLLERDSGTVRERRLLPEGMGRSEALELATLGNLLIVRGHSRTMVLTGTATEEQR